MYKGMSGARFTSSSSFRTHFNLPINAPVPVAENALLGLEETPALVGNLSSLLVHFAGYTGYTGPFISATGVMGATGPTGPAATANNAIVQNSSTETFTSTSFTSSAHCAVDMTPTTAAAKVFVTTYGMVNNTTATGTFTTIMRNGLDLSPGGLGLAGNNQAGTSGNLAMSIIDAPATTGLVVYSIGVKVAGGSANLSAPGTSATGIIAIQISS